MIGVEGQVFEVWGFRVWGVEASGSRIYGEGLCPMPTCITEP